MSFSKICLFIFAKLFLPSLFQFIILSSATFLQVSAEPQEST